MQCPQCSHENPDGVKFCGACGTRFASPCPSCGTGNPPANQFCHQCGQALAPPPTPATRFASPQSYTPPHLAEKILTSRTALAGERKQVTVLFADVSGFTSISERLDPEEVHQLMNRAFELSMGEVHRYEGTLNQFLGDGVMASSAPPLPTRTTRNGLCMRLWACSASCKATAPNSNAPRGSRFACAWA